MGGGSLPTLPGGRHDGLSGSPALFLVSTCPGGDHSPSVGMGGRIPCVSPGHEKWGSWSLPSSHSRAMSSHMSAASWCSATRGLQATPERSRACAHLEAKLGLFPLPTSSVGSSDLAMADAATGVWGSGTWLVPWGWGSLLCPLPCTCSAQICCSCHGVRRQGPVTWGVKSSATREAVW